MAPHLSQFKIKENIMSEILLTLLFFAFFFGFCIFLPASMARTRGRSAVLWVLVSLFLSPLLAILLLLVLGDAQD